MKVIGLETQKVYYVAEDKASAMRWMQQEYPYKDLRFHDVNHQNQVKTIPEPVKVFK